MSVSCDIFCAVVDNLGDAGVCWRLGRQLAGEHGWVVRLWIDDLTPLAALRPGIAANADQQFVDGVEVRRWVTALPASEPGDVVIEAFACELPAPFIEAMARRARPPVWLNLEYLSAEEWVAGCHGLASPHPHFPLTKYFFFPGFGTGTGGLIRERGLPSPPPHQTDRDLVVSLFCYENAALPRLLDAWASGQEPLACRVADGLAREQVQRWLGEPLPVSREVRRGTLRLIASPFVPQADYDSMLADCDLNFVRGEDSFVRAQWATRPFVWQIYAQEGDTHFDKLDAFLALYCRTLPTAPHKALIRFWRAWNGQGDVAEAWPAFRAALPRLQAHASAWAAEIAEPGDLAGNLVRFCALRL